MTEGHDDIHIDEGPTIPPSGPGRLLREARTAKGMTVRDVADALHLTGQTVENMEADRYEELPPATFVKGYLRSYAKLVDVKPYVVMAAFDQLGVEQDHHIVVRKPVRTAPEFGALGWLLIVGVVVVAGILLVYWNQGGLMPKTEGPSGAVAENNAGVGTENAAPSREPKPAAKADQSSPQSPPTKPEKPAAAPESAAAQQAPSAQTASSLESKPPAGSSSAAQGEAPTEPAGSAASAPEAQTPASTPTASGTQTAQTGSQEQAPAQSAGAANESSQASPPPAADTKELVLHFTGPSWMEVRDARGRRLLYELVQNTGDRTLRGVPPFSLVVGAPDAVSADLEGQHYAFPAHPGHVLRTEIPPGQ